MSPPASERAEPVAPDLHVSHRLRPSYGARTAQRAVPTTALNTSSLRGGEGCPKGGRGTGSWTARKLRRDEASSDHGFSTRSGSSRLAVVLRGHETCDSL